MIKCPLCQQTKLKTLYPLNDKTSSQKKKIFQCQNDNLVFAKTLTSKEKKEGKEKVKGNEINKEAEKEQEKVKDLYPYHPLLIKTYFNNKLTTINTHLIQTNITKDCQNKKGNQKKNKSKNKDNSKQTLKVLDIGSGWGDFLKVLEAAKTPYLGLENDRQKLKKLQQQGLNCQDKTLTQLIKEKQTFAAITCFQVVEHIKNPVSFLKEVKQLLKEKGILILTTPNHNSPLRKLKKAKWSVYNYPDHHLFFSKETLKQTLIKAGFKEKNIIVKLDQPRFFSLNYILKRLGKLERKKVINLTIPTDPFGDLSAMITNS